MDTGGQIVPKCVYFDVFNVAKNAKTEIFSPELEKHNQLQAHFSWTEVN